MTDSKAIPHVRVVNKNSEGAMVHSLDGSVKQRVPWAEFNELFTQVDDSDIYEMTLTPEVSAQVDRQVERFKFVGKYLYQIASAKKNPREYGNMILLGGIMQEYFTQFPECAPIDFIDDYKGCLNLIGAVPVKD